MIFHITTAAEWSAAGDDGHYRPDSLLSDGFIHCSDQTQVARVANAGFRGRANLVVLHIDIARVTAEIRYENLEGGEELFPHVYGPLPVGAVSRVTRLELGRRGAFEFPPPSAG
jgi:uncharacterized protein (DUF952 family)